MRIEEGPLETANAEQRRAADPAVSAFVSASAGTGKTKLLTDRLLRLMLAGTRPERILCLTYTKAAAAEMTIRLNRRLGEWVALPAPELARQLRALGVEPAPATCLAARRLFGEVLDLPGGMRIETIHAFCQSLLRRFPLEAGLSPHFRLEEGVQAATRLREAREHSLADPSHEEAIAALAGEIDERAFAELIAKLNEGDDSLHDLLRAHPPARIARLQSAALNAAFGTPQEIRLAAMRWPREAELRAALGRIAERGTNSGRKWALDGLAWLAQDAETRLLSWVRWTESHFTQAGERRKFGQKLGNALTAEHDLLQAELALEHERIERLEDGIKARALALLNAHLLQVAAPILRQDQGARSALAQVSYADLIAMTGRLLQDPGAAWVLYKLDGGITHLLLDEVQDTSPAQWRIANAIAEEFFAGLGANQAPRSIFAVGDAKQSIFSFQGADLRSFEQNRARFAARVRAAGQRWLDGELSVSFRSSAPVLRLVDAVFAAGQARDGVVHAGAALAHGVSRAGQAGSVTLWPLTEAAPAPAPPAWAVPEAYATEASAKAVLARQIAQHIRALLDAGHVLPGRGRALSPGDILILIRRREAFAAGITAELKKAGVPVAGVDRMALTEQQAVSDLLALCDALILPEDDLAFAQFLASPLGDLSDASLMRLAIGRQGRLHAALAFRQAESPDWQAAQLFFARLRSRVDFIPPYRLLMEALGELGGRARLLARLGPEASEPIDELLSEALAHAAREPVSMQQFLFQLRQSGAQIKREAEAAGDIVRIMTVHGAKGLQAPLVILPDTTGMPDIRETLLWLTQEGIAVPIYCPRKELRPRAVSAAIAADRAAKLEEHNRLLYVALTRAEDELIVCGARQKNALPEKCWYESVRAGFERLGVAPDAEGRRCLATPQRAAPDRAGPVASRAAATALPSWAGAAPLWQAAPPPPETLRPEPLAPSRNTEDARASFLGASPFAATAGALRQSRAAALAKGRMVHALLQHLPEIPERKRAAAARRYLKHAAPALAPAAQAAICDSVLGILQDPRLRPLFGPHSRAEAPVAGVVGDVEIGGLIDRLAIGEAEILLADYKTDRAPPEDAAGVPGAYLRQLAAYAALLAQIHPGHRVTCALIWTQNARHMLIPPALLAAHAPAAGRMA